MANAAAQIEVLEALADTPPRAYLQRGPGGQSQLRELYRQAVQAELAARNAADDIACLHALFDVALDHGLGSLVRDYLAEVCSDRLLTSSDPVEAFLLDAECVRRWVQKLLAVSRGRLASWLARGLGGALGGDAGGTSKELGRLEMVLLVAEALVQQPGAAAAQQQAGQQAGGRGGSVPAVPAEPAEVVEARRLVSCARVLSWLAHSQSAQHGFDRPAGRFFSEQEWRSVAAKRREGAATAGVGGLFLADLAAELARQGVPEASLAYPPPTPDRLVSALFLGQAAPGGSAGGGGSSSAAGGGAAMAVAGLAKPGSKAAAGKAAGADAGGAGPASLDARLAMLAYYLADGGFLTPAAIVQGLGMHFHVPAPAANAWVLQQLLDDAHTADAAGALSLQRAAQLVPAVDGSRLPHKALQVFAARGQLDAALCLLRQRQESTVRLDEASVALSVRLQNGLLGEAFMGLRQHLAAVGAAAPTGTAGELQRRHAQLLLGQLLQFAATTTQSAVHAVARLPFGGPEEQAVVGWLEAQSGAGRLEAALMLPIYFLLRGRTPEALHAYACHCPRAPTTQQQQELAALLAEAARMLPAPQRALVVQPQKGAAAALLPAGAGAGEEGVGLALMGAIPSLAADVAPAMLAVGPTAAQAPLVGSVAVLLEQQRRAAGAAAATAGAAQAAAAAGATTPGSAATAQQQQAQGAGQGVQPPSLFGPPAAASSGVGGGAPSFGAALAAAAAADEAMADAASVPGGRAGAGSGAHEFDRVLGLGGPAGTARGAGGGKSKRRWGGSAYR